jgi:hypothetical protein
MSVTTDDSCIVGHENYIAGIMVYGHSKVCAARFHYDCIHHWAYKLWNIDCPACRQPFAGLLSQDRVTQGEPKEVPDTSET